MWKVRIRTVIALGLMAAAVLVECSCAAKRPPSVDRSHALDCPKPGVPLVPNHDNCSFDWQHEGPLDFLAFLQRNDSDFGACFITCRHVGWIKRADVPKLIGLLDSKASCHDVYPSTTSGYLQTPDVDTSVAFQALVMLESYQKGYYPCFDKVGEPFSERRREFLDWWRRQQH